jgi:hypothetical protein
MRRILKPTLLLFLVANVFFGSVSAADNLPDKKEVREWAKKARETGDLQSLNAPPYHLRATIRYTLGAYTGDGTYEVLWAAPDRYRVEFRVGDFGETDLVLGDKKYVKRNTPTMTFPMWSVSSVLFPSLYSASPTVSASPSLHKLSSVRDGSTREICATFGGNLSLDEVLCFDATTHELVSTRIHPPGDDAASKGSEFLDLTDYMSLGKMRYPQHLSRRSGPETVDLVVETWQTTAKFDANVFTPFADGAAWNWCSKPEIQWPKSWDHSFVPPVSVNPVNGTLSFQSFGLYKVVGADGTPREVTLLFGSPEGATKQLLEMQRRGRSALHICDGKPVEYETIVAMWPMFTAH